MLQRVLPEKGDKTWFLVAVIGAVFTAAVVAIGTRLIIGAPAEGANGLLQAFLVGLLVFGVYWLVAAIAGYFGLRAMPLILAGGMALAVMAMLWSLHSLGNEGWGGAAAVGALVQVTGLAIITAIVTEVGLYIWSVIDRRKTGS